VTLSGGGFRATLFHLGAVLWLRKEQLLDGKTRIYGVSGGAILAAHLGVNWDKYLGSEEELQSCIESLLRLIRSDIRNRVFRNHASILGRHCVAQYPASSSTVMASCVDSSCGYEHGHVHNSLDH
jgi:predicted acylesterase/phospholipase RssA